MTTNNAAYLPSPSAKPLEIRPTEHRYPDETELVIRTAAVAINQIDWKIQDSPWTDFPYPLILGEDVAGTVVDVGSCVTRFEKGDRVIGHAVGVFSGDERHGGFQEYVVLEENMAAAIPGTMGFEKGVVLPLGVSTASAALFQGEGQGGLGLARPSIDSVKRADGETVLVWGGTTSVGSNAIQLAVAAGYEVIATASEKNFGYVRKLGAGVVVDYKSKGAVQDVVAAFQGKKLAGAFDTVGSADSSKATVAVVQQVEGNKVVASVDELEDLPLGVTGVDVQAVAIRENDVSEMIYGDYLPKALAAGKYLTAPEPYIAGVGLKAIQGTFEAQKKASARKVVVTIF
ncbi:zinc-binding alcohol dehydrogenase family protein [Aspergillus lucknowensis]|uniref:Chaperonin 10-like protein n=1 Tax=Aspergillus lucknowensis TaxID=176173 RepID=A0ABR4LT56_9EURO